MNTISKENLKIEATFASAKPTSVRPYQESCKKVAETLRASYDRELQKDEKLNEITKL